MQHLTVAERLLAIVVVALVAVTLREMLPLPAGAGAHWWAVALDAGLIVLVLGFTAAVARSLARPLVQAIAALDALDNGALAPSQPAPVRGEIGRLRHAIDRLDHGLKERQRRERERTALDHGQKAARRANLTNMAKQVEIATEGGMVPIVDGSAVLRAKATTCARRLKPPTRPRPRRSARRKARAP